MILQKIFRYEFGYQLGRTSTWLYLTVLLAFTMVMNVLTTPGDGVYPNNTFYLTALTVIGSLIWLVMGASIAGEAAARDVQARMHPLIYTTPVKKLHYLAGRFLAALAVNALLILALPLGVLLSFYLPGMAEGELLPFRPFAYTSVYFFIALPNAFIVTATQFACAALSRRVMTSFIASLLLAMIAQIFALTVAKVFGNWNLATLLDPVGVAGIIGNELQTWTPTEKNWRLVELEGMFLWNRVLWLGVATGLLGLTYFRFSFTMPITKSWWSQFKWKKKAEDRITIEPAVGKTNAIAVPQVQQSFGFTSYCRQALKIAFTSFKIIAKHPLGLTVVGAFALGSAVFGDSIISEIGIPLFPTTPLVLDYLTAPVSNISTPWGVIPLLILYFVGELVWQERESGMADLTDAAPVPEWAWLSGKFLGIGLIIFAWMAMLMAGGILMQFNLNYPDLSLGLYVQVLFGIQLLDYFLFALLALVVHVVVNQKYIGYLVVLLLFGLMAFPHTFGVEHPMLIYGADPGWWYTDMRGFGPTIWPWLWFKLYWMSWALLLAVAGRLLWPRGREHSLQQRIRNAKHRFTGSTPGLTLLGSGLLFFLGCFVFYNTNVLNEYRSGADLNERKATYERRYGQYRNSPQPQLTATKLQVEIFPEQQQVEIRAAYTLVNKYTIPIDTIQVSGVLDVAFIDVTFDRPASEVLLDKILNYHQYALPQALQPGDSLQMAFVVQHKAKGFGHRATGAWVVEKGTYFTNFDLLPTIGYQRQREIKDAIVRKKHKLPARPTLPSLYDVEARNQPYSADITSFEAIIGTTKQEVAVAPGALLNTWTTGGRRYFHYKTGVPIGGEYSILSGNYTMRESEWNGVAIRIYHSPNHDKNLDRMFRSIKTSLAYYTQQFGPYPFGHLTLVERAGAGVGATADAGIIYYGEQYAHFKPDDSPEGFDLPYYIIAHEVAHQWWGMARLTPAQVEGAGVLIEGLAVYSGMQVLEKEYGEGHMRKYVSYLHATYDIPRSRATPSLIRANEEFLYYKKGGLALHALSKYIGKEKVNAALRQLLQKRSSGALPLPTTQDLYEELQKFTPDSLRYLLHDLFKENTYWRLKTTKMAAEQTIAGSWQVQLQVQAQKLVVDSTGQERDVPMQDCLEVGIYEEGKGLNQPLYLQRHCIRSGEQSLQITVPRKPDRAAIDPNQLLIDLRLDDNMIYLEGD